MAFLLVAVGLLASCGSGKSKKAATEAQDSVAVTYGKPVPNPYLSSEHFAITHFDAGQSDAFPYPIPTGTFNVDLSKFPRVPGGPVGFMQMISTDPNYMWVTTTSNVNYVDVSNNGWKVVATIKNPGSANITKEMLDKGLNEKLTSIAQAETIVFNDWKTTFQQLGNNVYMFVDKDNVLYATTETAIHAYGLIDPADPSKGIKIIRTLDFKPELKKIGEGSKNPSFKLIGARILGINVTYDGRIIILTGGSVSIIDREFKEKPQTIMLDADEYITNGACVDENNGIYVASDKLMHKFVWTGAKLSTEEADGAWSSPYDFGQQPPAVKFGTGTGSTPTLMGFGDDEDKLVVITDGANRMNIVAFWRNDIPADAKQQEGTKSNRIAGQLAATCGLNPQPDFIQTEQSAVVMGYGAFVVNNVRPEGNKDRLVDVLAGGPVYAPPVGCERFEWDPKANKWNSVWTRNDVVATSMIPGASTTSNIVCVNGYTAKDGWELTGMDWKAGKTVTRYIFGQSNYGNGAYATIQFFPNGDLLFNSVGGPIRVSVNR